MLDKVSDMVPEFERLQPGGNEETKSKVQSLLKSVRFAQRKFCSRDSMVTNRDTNNEVPQAQRTSGKH